MFAENGSQTIEKGSSWTVTDDWKVLVYRITATSFKQVNYAFFTGLGAACLLNSCSMNRLVRNFIITCLRNASTFLT